MAKYDYHPNNSARALRSGNNRIIGVVLSDISNRFFAEVSRNIEDWTNKYGYMVIFSNTDENAGKLAEGVELLYSRGVQGLIIVPCLHSEKIIDSYKSKIPIVLLDRDYAGSELCSVVLDNKKSASELTGRLIERGHRNIEFVSYSTTLKNIIEREDGYRSEMRKSGLETNIKVHHPEYGNYGQVEEIILHAAGNGTEAIIFATYHLALLGRRAMIHNNIKVPCAFACFNNSDTFDIYERGMLYVKQPIEKFAKHAVELLMKRISGEKAGSECEKIVLPPEIETTEI
ncbi:MAG: substrate-binding domain-containing protein [Bacteroidales bacterium]|nr:substrate-binding domain-containing protein [Bacteroidales bacterium]